MKVQYCALNWTIGQQHHLRTKEISKAKALLGCKNQMLHHCSRINHVHFGVILAAWELYLSSNFNFIEQCKISQFFFNMTFVISEGECISCTKSSIVAILFSPLSLQTHYTSQIMQFQHDDSLLSYKNFFHMTVAFWGSRHDNSEDLVMTIFNFKV
jgi:hypothetical protein